MVGLETRRYGGLEDTIGDGASLGNGAAAGRGVALLLLLLPLSPTDVTETGRS